MILRPIAQDLCIMVACTIGCLCSRVIVSRCVESKISLAWAKGGSVWFVGIIIRRSGEDAFFAIDAALCQVASQSIVLFGASERAGIVFLRLFLQISFRLQCVCWSFNFSTAYMLGEDNAWCRNMVWPEAKCGRSSPPWNEWVFSGTNNTCMHTYMHFYLHSRLMEESGLMFWVESRPSRYGLVCQVSLSMLTFVFSLFAGHWVFRVRIRCVRWSPDALWTVVSEAKFGWSHSCRFGQAIWRS